jgi:hypothetical protein
MSTYTVRKVYQYTETVEVEATSEREAKDKAASMEGDRNFDDHLHDCYVASVKSDQGSGE